MTVAELIELLQTFPQDTKVAYHLYSESCLLEAKDIELEECGESRGDGWVPRARPDKPTCTYLMFPGN